MEGLGVQLRVPIEAMEQVCSIKALLQGRPTGVEVGMNHHEKIRGCKAPDLLYSSAILYRSARIS